MDEVLREYLSKHGVHVLKWQDLVSFPTNWSRGNSVWPMTFGLACCAIEMISAAMARWDIARLGSEVFRPSPRQADLMIVAGTVTKKMAPLVVRLFNQIPEPRYVMAVGSCAISGGPFRDGYNVLNGIDRYIPVDVYVPGCPPQPESIINGLLELQRKIAGERLLGKENGMRIHNPDFPSEYPIPECGEHDLEPPYNSSIADPRVNDYVPQSPAQRKIVISAVDENILNKVSEDSFLQDIQKKAEAAISGLKLKLVKNPNANPQQDTIFVEPEYALRFASFLRDEPEYLFDFLTCVSATDWLEQEIQVSVQSAEQVDEKTVVKKKNTIAKIPAHIDVCYVLCSTKQKVEPIIICQSTHNRADDCRVASLTPVWRSAEFQEREIYDLYGVEFIGHPDLRRILLWDTCVDHPMRKDYVHPEEIRAGKEKNV